MSAKETKLFEIDYDGETDTIAAHSEEEAVGHFFQIYDDLFEPNYDRSEIRVSEISQDKWSVRKAFNEDTGKPETYEELLRECGPLPFQLCTTNF